MNIFYYNFKIHHIQSFIFETNKLKEIIGASEIIETICKCDFKVHFKKFFCKEGSIQRTAGKIQHIFRIEEDDLDSFKELYASFSKAITLKYPEVKFCQIVQQLDEKTNITEEHIEKADKTIQQKRQDPTYYPRLACMGIARNQRTGKIQCNADKEYDIATAKKNECSNGKLLLKKLENIKANFPKELSEIVSDDNYLALIHIDTNGLGDYLKKEFLPNIKNVAELKEFSKEMEESTQSALVEAIEQTFPYVDDAKKEKTIPFRPVLIGGDDITVIIRAKHAFTFTIAYLKAFKENTQEIEVSNNKEFTACAGIAFTKQKFPLHYTADLVESLCKSAKDGSKRLYDAIRVHRVRNTYAKDYDRIKETELRDKEDKSFYDEKPFSEDGLKRFQDDLKIIKEEKFPKSDLENYLTHIINDHPQQNFLKERMLEKLPKSSSELIKKMKEGEQNLSYLYQLVNLQKFSN